MSELTITRSRDIILYASGEQLYGVVYFKAVSERKSRDIFEYLSSEPFASAGYTESFEIKLTVLSLFNSGVLITDGFTLSVVDGDTEYVFEGCRVTRREQELDAGKSLSESYTIKSQKMTKRGVEDE